MRDQYASIDQRLKKIYDELRERLDRAPTEEEMHYFIFGNEFERDYVWNGMAYLLPTPETMVFDD